jgi:hypothetical protein
MDTTIWTWKQDTVLCVSMSGCLQLALCTLKIQENETIYSTKEYQNPVYITSIPKQASSKVKGYDPPLSIFRRWGIAYRNPWLVKMQKLGRQDYLLHVSIPEPKETRRFTKYVRIPNHRKTRPFSLRKYSRASLMRTIWPPWKSSG